MPKKKLSPKTILERRMYLYDTYGRYIYQGFLLRVLQCRRWPKELDIEIDDLHLIAESLLVNIVKNVDITNWPPNKNTHQQMDQLLDTFLDETRLC